MTPEEVAKRALNAIRGNSAMTPFQQAQTVALHVNEYGNWRAGRGADKAYAKVASQVRDIARRIGPARLWYSIQADLEEPADQLEFWGKTGT